MGRHSFIQIQKLPDVSGRIDYISSHEKQENLYATYQTADNDFWHSLAEESQQEFLKSGTRGKCIEARELIIALPERYTEFPPQEVLELFTNDFADRHHVECVSALHHNKKKTNYHIHLIFSERQFLKEPQVKVASRNMFYNEHGEHVRTKKEISDETGIRKGCKIIPKGGIYEQRLFSPKNSYFKSEQFLLEEKRLYTDLINKHLDNPAEKLQVFKGNGIYLPTRKIGKNNPKRKEILADNKIRQEWNYSVDEALITGMDEKEIYQVKTEEITLRVKNSIAQNGRQPNLFYRIVEQAVSFLKMLIEKWKVPPRPVLKIDMAEFRNMQNIKQQLEGRLMAIQQVENQVIPELIHKIDSTKGIFKGKERKELQEQLSEEKKRLLSMKQSFSAVVQGAGFHTVQDFILIYRKAENEVLRYQKEMEHYTAHGGTRPPEKESVRKRLNRLIEENKQTSSVVKKRNGREVR